MRIHYFKINERERENGRAAYFHYLRRFWHAYKQYRDGTERGVGEFHLETIWHRVVREHLFSARLHVGNAGSETPWDGHLIILGMGFYWGWSRGRRLASWITRCEGYKYDTREWSLRIFDNRLWWEIGNHGDMCSKHRMAWGRRIVISEGTPGTPGYGKKKRRPRRSLQAGSINLSVPEAIWGPKRYSYEDVESYATTIKLADGAYGVVIKLQRCHFGRTKVDRSKHLVSWTLDVDAPKGIPTHVDHSGGWKGDRTYGFGVDFAAPRGELWFIDAEAAVTAWVLAYRAKSGFREPDPIEAD